MLVLNVKQLTLLLLVIVFLVIACALVWNSLTNSQTIVYDGLAFEPSSIEVEVGTTVTFRNDSQEEFWPASDLHPSHGAYPSFDPKRPVGPGQTWQFTFDQPGAWSYHDHLRSIATGLIIVGDVPAANQNSCGDELCWSQQVLTAFELEGMKAAFSKLTALYQSEPDFKQSCHSITHTLGEQAYYLFSNNENFKLTQDTAYCGYGFYHGFMETLLFSTGDIELAREFCTYANEQLTPYAMGAGNACYHGIGHGFTDGSDPRTWGSASRVIARPLEMCEIVAESDEQKYLCATGVFNGLAIARAEGLYDLDSSPDTVFEPCYEMSDEHFKLACYEQMNTLIVREAEWNPNQVFAIVSSLKEPAYSVETLQSALVMLVYGAVDLSEIEQISVKCLQAMPDHEDACVHGVVSGIIEFGTPREEHIEALQFCEAPSLSDDQKTSCYRSVVTFADSNMGGRARAEVCKRAREYSPQDFQERCEM